MTKQAFTRSGVLTEAERLKSANKCIALLEPEAHCMTAHEKAFLAQMRAEANKYGVTERQLAWLRDLVEQYAC